VRRVRMFIAAGLCLAPLLGLTARGSELGAKDPGTNQPPPQPPPNVKLVEDQPATCGQFGTSVHFLATPREAGDVARKEEKLVFVLHLSGIFEDANFT
jgi:hypothetical protein